MLAGYDGSVAVENSNHIMPKAIKHTVGAAQSFFPNQDTIIKNFLFAAQGATRVGQSVDFLPDSSVLDIPEVNGAMIDLTAIYNDSSHQDKNEPVQIFNPYTEKATADYD
jgi:hypothetical protein